MNDGELLAPLERLEELCAALPDGARDEARVLIAGLRLDVQHAQEEHRELAERQAEAIVNAGMMVSELEETHKALDLARAAAEAASVAKSQFLANMSHEIRTPMNGVLGMLQLVLESPLESAQRGRLQTADRSARALLALLNDVLEFSRLETGRIEFEHIAFSVARIAQDVAALFSPACAEKGIEIRCCFDPLLADVYCGDPHRIRQVLGNLVGNAVKFTARGAIAVRIARVQCDESSDGLRIEVVDSGIGIPEERLDRLFNAFSQVDASTARRYGGSGLGLAICHQIATQMGGRLDVSSIVGVGTTFTWRLSLERMPAGSASDTGAHHAMSGGLYAGTPAAHPSEGVYAGCRLLLVDDNEINRELALGMLEMYGVEVDCAENGLQALARLEQAAYDLVLMDCHMPEMDGYAATSEWRAREARATAARTPIIALTAAAMAGDRERCQSAGMDDYVTKPFNRAMLDATLARWLGEGGNGKRVVGARRG